MTPTMISALYWSAIAPSAVGALAVNVPFKRAKSNTISSFAEPVIGYSLV